MFDKKSELIVLLTILSFEFATQKSALAFMSNSRGASERIIQEETMSFELCLTVISNSADKLGIEPEISDIDERKRLAKFSLSDGALKILCDGVSELLLVSTE